MLVICLACKNMIGVDDPYKPGDCVICDEPLAELLREELDESPKEDA